jgi:methyl-accepting chemotaxis protein
MNFLSNVRSSLKTKLIALVVSLALVPLLLFGGFTIYENFSVLEEQSLNQLENTTLKKEASLNKYIHQTEQLAETIRGSDEVSRYVNSNLDENLRPPALDHIVDIQEPFWGDYHHIFLANPEGEVVLSPSPPAGYNHLGQNVIEDAKFDEKYFERALDGTVITPFFGFEESDHYHPLFMAPIEGAEGVTQAVLVVELEISHIIEILNENFQYGETGKIDLSTLDGRKVVKFQDEEVTTFNDEMIKRANENGMARGRYSDRGVDTYGAFKKDSEHPWIIAVQAEASEVLASAWTITYYYLIGIFLAGGLAFLIGLWYSWNLSGFLQKITEQARRLAEGDYDIEPDEELLNRSDELGEVARAFRDVIENPGSEELVQQAEAIARGDLDADVLDREIKGDLGDAFGEMIEHLSQLLRSLQETAERTSEVSSQVLSASEELDQAADNQSELLESSSSGVTELSQSVEEISANADDGQETARDALKQARDGYQSVDDVVSAMNEIRDRVDSVAQGVDKLSEAGEEIGQIVNVISDIAEKTSLLALNAAIEAERAGEEGQGFAVVAEEVSDLADQVQSSVDDIESLIQDIRTRTEQSATAMSEVTDEVNQGVELAENAGDALQSILNSVEDTEESIDSIADSLQQQTVASDEVANSVEQVNLSSEEIATSADHLVAEGEKLDELSGRLNEILENFSLAEN